MNQATTNPQSASEKIEKKIFEGKENDKLSELSCQQESPLKEKKML